MHIYIKTPKYSQIGIQKNCYSQKNKKYSICSCRWKHAFLLWNSLFASQICFVGKKIKKIEKRDNRIFCKFKLIYVRSLVNSSNRITLTLGMSKRYAKGSQNSDSQKGSMSHTRNYSIEHCEIYSSLSKII